MTEPSDATQVNVLALPVKRFAQVKQPHKLIEFYSSLCRHKVFIH
jgi:hypothetical protein